METECVYCVTRTEIFMKLGLNFSCKVLIEFSVPVLYTWSPVSRNALIIKLIYILVDLI